MESPLPGPATGPGDIWAAGYHYPSGTSDYQGLIEHYDGKQWRRVSSAQGGSYTYLSGITAWTPGAGWAVGNTLTATIAESICEIQVNETGFDPATAPAVQGDTIGWTIVSGDSHRLKDPSGMALFDSGTLAAVSSFQYTFNSAGTYSVTDRATRATSSVAVPVAVPSTGKTGKPLLVTWSAAAPAIGLSLMCRFECRRIVAFTTGSWDRYRCDLRSRNSWHLRFQSPVAMATHWRSLKMVATGCGNRPKSLGIFDPATGTCSWLLPHCVPL